MAATATARNGRTLGELDARARQRGLEESTVVRCALCPDWSFEGTAAEGREAFRLHREHEHEPFVNGSRTIRAQDSGKIPERTGSARKPPESPEVGQRPTRPSRGLARSIEAGTLAIATTTSGNRKIGAAATTYAEQRSCPTSCVFFDGGGCYAEAGQIGKFVTAPLNAAARAVEAGPVEIALAEARAIDEMETVVGRPLRLHTVGDCSTDEAAAIVAEAAGRYMDRGGGPVWTYTHAWRDVPRAAWGRVSVLASCETPLDVELARSRGYATAIVLQTFEVPQRYQAGTREGPVDVLPCPAQTRDDVTCASCRLCMDDVGVFKRGYSIAFAVHGNELTKKKAGQALATPDDPDRKLTSRELIPRFSSEFRRKEKRDPTAGEISRSLGLNRRTVDEMLATLEREGTPVAVSRRTSRPNATVRTRLRWSEAAIIEAIQAYAIEHGHPPTANGWVKTDGTHPTQATVIRVFGSWAEAIERAGFERPTRGGRVRVEPQPPTDARVHRLSEAKSRGWISVRGTGLVYRDPLEGYAAADELEHRAEREAGFLREEGHDGAADTMIDSAREQAERIRAAMREAEDRASTVEPAPPEDELDRLYREAREARERLERHLARHAPTPASAVAIRAGDVLELLDPESRAVVQSFEVGADLKLQVVLAR